MTTIRNLIEARRADKEDEGGFTLIELLIVVVVLGILAAIVVFAVQNLTGQSAQAACKSDGKTVEVALEAQRAQVPTATFNGYATTIGDLAPAYIKSVPNSTKYAVSLGTKQSAGGPTIAAGGAGLAPTAFPAGTVLISAGADYDPVAANREWKDLNWSEGSPCNAVV